MSLESASSWPGTVPCSSKNEANGRGKERGIKFLDSLGLKGNHLNSYYSRDLFINLFKQVGSNTCLLNQHPKEPRYHGGCMNDVYSVRQQSMFAPALLASLLALALPSILLA